MDRNAMTSAPPPSFAVVVPVHNKAAHLARSFASIFAQTYPPAEIIAVDDASTDNSRELLRAIDHPHFRLIERDPPNAGPGGARNIGIRAAQSDWIVFLDADDEWQPDLLEMLANQARAADDGVSLIFTGFLNDYGGRRKLHEYTVASAARGVHRLDLKDYLTAWLTVKRSPAHTSSIAVRRRVIEAVGMFQEGPTARRGQDIALWLRCVAYGDAIAIPQIGAIYYREAENMTTKMISTNSRPAIWYVIRDLLPTRAPDEQRLLKRLNNHIIYDYARIATRNGRFSWDRLKDLYLTGDVRTLIALSLLVTLPSGARSSLGTLRRRWSF